MGIVNPSHLTLYQDIDASLLTLVEDVLFDRHPESTERLVANAANFATSTTAVVESEAWRDLNVHERLSHALVHGITEHIEADVEEAYSLMGGPLGDRGPVNGWDERGG